MAALTNILSLELFTIPLVIGPFSSKIHFTQLPIFISSIIAGPIAGLYTGVIGGLYMSYLVGIPFIIGGLAILGYATGYFTKNLKLRPFFSSLIAWGVQAPYVFVTDYLWFIHTRTMPSEVAFGVVSTILIKLTIEAIIAATVATIIIHYIRRMGLLRSG